MPILTIDGQEIEVEAGTTIIQAAERLGIEIPRFCYHERLAIAGNCRMCLVEVSPGPPKPQASCALPCADKMVVKTNSEMVKKAREGVMEFLLINHPLDCPICDQAGECDLQDQSLMYGKGSSRYDFAKRAVEDKYMGPIVKTEMTRCIQCTRCIRFAEDVAGVPELGAFARGEHMEVGTFVEQSLTSEMSGNLVDLCPVGALTSKPYAYIARPWELRKTESVDVMDAVGSNIRIDARQNVVLRVLPRVHEQVNEEWISDKTRHACDGLRRQRLDTPYVRNAEGVLQASSWEQALQAVALRMQQTSADKMAAIAGNLVGVEAVFALKQLMQKLGVNHLDCRQEGAMLPFASRGDYLFNSGIAGIDQADAILFIGVNPRLEAPIINTRIRKRWLKGGLRVANIGEAYDLTYKVEQLGNDPRAIAPCEALKNAKNPMVILGSSALARPDGAAIYTAARQLLEQVGGLRGDWNGFNILHHAASRAGALDVGFVPQNNGRDIAQIFDACQGGEMELVYLLGADEFDMSLLGKAFVVYQGHHGDAGAHRADVILPAAAYTEQDALYVNTEGRVQAARRAVFPPGQAQEDWAIIRMLSNMIGQPLTYSTLDALRAELERMHPHFAERDVLHNNNLLSPATHAVNSGKNINPFPLESFVQNFYQTDPISRASVVMAECVREILKLAPEKKAA